MTEPIIRLCFNWWRIGGRHRGKAYLNSSPQFDNTSCHLRNTLPKWCERVQSNCGLLSSRVFGNTLNHTRRKICIYILIQPIGLGEKVVMGLGQIKQPKFVLTFS